MRCMEMPSPNYDDRSGTAIDMLVLHYTGMMSAKAALEQLCDPAAKVSSHYTVDEDGMIYVHVPEKFRAWHAGVSSWAGQTNINACSIGIELVNPGHEFGYRDFPDIQIESLITLCRKILRRNSIASWRVLAHSDVAPARKQDPGERFPWERLANAGIGLWPSLGQGRLGSEALSRFGYDLAVAEDKVITAFQRHFRPQQIDGNWDDDCAQRLASLLMESGL